MTGPKYFADNIYPRSNELLRAVLAGRQIYDADTTVIVELHPDGILVDHTKLADSYLSTTETAVAAIAAGLATLEARGGAGHLNRRLIAAVEAVAR